MGSNTNIPNIWDELEQEGSNMGISKLLNIWKNRLRTSKTENNSKPKVVLCVSFPKMVNMIPQDAPHPLYCSDYFSLTDEFILDHLCMDAIDMKDSALESEEGVTLKTMSGKNLVFKKAKEDEKARVNEIEVETVNDLSDGTTVVIIKDFLFSHFEDSQKAFKKLSSDITNEFCPLHQS